jgi:hypothetical protein
LRVFENRVLRIMFVPKRKEVNGGFRKWHYNKLHYLCPSANVIRMFKSRRMCLKGIGDGLDSSCFG